MSFPLQMFLNDISHGYRATILKKHSLWLLPFLMAVATYCYYEKMRRMVRTAIISYLLKCLIQLYKHFCWTITVLKICWETVTEWPFRTIDNINNVICFYLHCYYWAWLFFTDRFIYNFMINNTAICFPGLMKNQIHKWLLCF